MILRYNKKPRTSGWGGIKYKKQITAIEQKQHDNNNNNKTQKNMFFTDIYIKDKN